MKKGFTLIELVVTIAIVSMLICLELTIFSTFILSYKRNIKGDRENFYIRDGLSFIECKAANNENISILNNNKMQIKKVEFISNRAIRYTYGVYLNTRGEIIVNYNEDGIDLGTNVITDSVKVFKIEIYNKILYIHIVSNGGAVFEKCIGIN